MKRLAEVHFIHSIRSPGSPAYISGASSAEFRLEKTSEQGYAAVLVSKVKRVNSPNGESLEVMETKEVPMTNVKHLAWEEIPDALMPKVDQVRKDDRKPVQPRF